MRLVIPIRLVVMVSMAVWQGLIGLLLDMSCGCVHDTAGSPSIALNPGDEDGQIRAEGGDENANQT